MGCWGITAFESDAGLDSVDYIRSNLPKGGKLDLGEIIDALQNDQIRLPDVEFAENHTSPMALAEIVDTIPIFSRRLGLKGGLGILVVLMALGRSIGGILHFYMRW